MHYETLAFDETLSSSKFQTATDENVTLITGANGGIAFAIITQLLTRPHNTVIATVRRLTPAFQSALAALPAAHPTAKLYVSTLPSFGAPTPRDTDAAFANIRAALAAHPLPVHVNTLIACAGAVTEMLPARDSTPDALRYIYEVNVLGPLVLFQTFYAPLQAAAKTGTSAPPKFVAVSSYLGSSKLSKQSGPSVLYSSSKAALNNVARKIHFEEDWLVSFALHPGWVQTNMGQHYADAIGAESAPMTVEESAEGSLKVIDDATKDTTSGQFVNYNGAILPF